MRLSERQVQIIRETVAELLGPEAEVRVFGSRVDDRARGGDIDLLVRCPRPITDRHGAELRLGARLEMRLDGHPVDVFLLDPRTERRPIHEEALRTGVTL